MSLLSKIRNRIAGAVPVKPMAMRGDGGIISFTFDDAPLSALEAGGAILRRHGVAGTYYIAGGLTGALENGHPCHSREALAAAARDGHEIASHGFAHIPYSRASAARIEADLDANQRFLRQALPGMEERAINFSYPFGERSLAAKRLLARRFTAARGIRGGINGPLFDLADLRANELYAHSINEARITRLIARAARRKAWLIFYTHDVADQPSPYGITPAMLEFAVKAAAASPCRVLPMRAALGALSFGPLLRR